MSSRLCGWTIVILIALTLSGCFSGSSNEPSSEDIKKSLMLKLPPIVVVNELDIDVSQNTGTEVEPFVSSRFKGELELTEALYQSVDHVMGKAILEETASEGTNFKVFGISEATLKLESWDIEFEKLDISPRIAGKPLSEWSSGGYVFAGSAAEEELRKAYEEKLAIEKKAEEERRLEAEKLEKERLAKQRIEEERKRELAAKKKAADIKTLTAILTSGKAQVGEAGDRRSSWPFRLTFQGFDASSNKFTGKMEWPTLSGITKIEGTLIGDSLVFKEVAHIKRGSVDLNTLYELRVTEGGKVKGVWNRRSQNYVWFDINT
ncbi:hypothetical protein [Pseudidiomarina homiensis]|uniref:Lipoprotein n=1 Tax=Pseudidiomarina homiensis TaxID=364198 RepID=A0A432Y667_9GAMM|nr:hypothetical protein [Pseudidiomarina homiensis]RUO56464.1 hypothetical protein CWI70_06900 [Pseudidiomarina homiensis]